MEGPRAPDYGNVETLARLAGLRSEAALAAELRQIASAPPRSDAEIGFYGVEHEPAGRRAWLAGLSRADDAGLIASVEDKYAPEWFALVAEFGWIGEGRAAQRAAEFAEEVEMLEDLDGPSAARAAGRRVMERLPAALDEVEAAMGRRGLLLVSFDATDGDTVFYAALSEDERAALGAPPLPPGVRPFDRARFTSLFAYAVEVRCPE